MAGPQVGDDLELTFTDGVAHIALNRPDKLNAMTRTIQNSFIECIKWAGVAPEVRAVLISGKGRMFCSGDDLDGLGSLHGAGPSPLTECVEGPGPLLSRLIALRKPVVCAVQGGAYVAGLDLALACDFRVASAGTKLGPISASLGGAGGMALLTLYVPIATARRILFEARPIGGEEALKLGLVDELVETDAILDRAMEIAKKYAVGPTLAYGAIKSSLLSMIGVSPLQALHMEQDYSLTGYGTHDYEEALKAWQEKRPPQFLGR
ncbi:enoyl-CoA hydratase/isomerase family protein [Mesorhizobium abyssinicae]|uniref:enoyl-CoA hydratase/isomerase family protein n=1 Tax=Mesorhizobium abyssinicae TaxID=1209958 RepID=UPI00339A0D3D